MSDSTENLASKIGTPLSRFADTFGGLLQVFREIRDNVSPALAEIREYYRNKNDEVKISRSEFVAKSAPVIAAAFVARNNNMLHDNIAEASVEISEKMYELIE